MMPEPPGDADAGKDQEGATETVWMGGGDDGKHEAPDSKEAEAVDPVVAESSGHAKKHAMGGKPRGGVFRTGKPIGVYLLFVTRNCAC